MARTKRRRTSLDGFENVIVAPSVKCPDCGRYISTSKCVLHGQGRMGELEMITQINADCPRCGTVDITKTPWSWWWKGDFE